MLLIPSRSLLLLLLLYTATICHCAQTRAQARWVRQAANTVANSIALDAAGNAYVTGAFRGAVALGQETLTGPTATSNGFVVKYDTEGAVLWARPTTGAVSLNDIAVDKQGNVYVTGTFEGTITAGSTLLSSQGAYDLLLLKYDTKGNLLWARQGGSAAGSTMQGAGLAVDPTGNSYVTGSFDGTMRMDGFTMTSDSKGALLLLKYDQQGKLLWTQRGSGAGMKSSGAAVGVDAAGNAYVTGGVSGDGFFGTVSSRARSQQASLDAVVVKCDVAGNFVWARRDGNGAEISGRDIAVDQQGNAVITGMVNKGTATFDTYLFTITSVHDGFVARYDANGALQWADQIEGTDTDYGTSVALDAASNAYVTGVFASQPTTWGGTTTLSRKEGKNAFAVKYSPAGKVLVAQREGACGGTFSMGIAVNSASEIYIAGSFSGTVSFVSTLLTSQGSLFVAKLGDLSTPSTPDSFSCNSVSIPPTPPTVPTSPTPPTVPTPPTTPTVPTTPTIPTPPTTPTTPTTPAPPTTPTTPVPASQPAASTLIDIFVPNIITPNNDGRNDYLTVRSPDALVWALTVYNRWGKQVYATPAYRQNWNANGLPDGTYYYHLQHPSGLQVKGWVEVRR